MSEFVRVKNRVHGGVTELHPATLPYLPNWERVDGPNPDKPKPNVQLPRASQAPSKPTSAAPAVSDEKE